MGTKLRVSFGSLQEELELRCRSDTKELVHIIMMLMMIRCSQLEVLIHGLVML
jgi:hypothetical protein